MQALHSNIDDARVTSSNLIKICEGGLEDDSMPDHVRLECPKQLFEVLKAQISSPEELEKELVALQQPPPLTIRVNSIKSSVSKVRSLFEKIDIPVTPGRFSPLSFDIQKSIALVSLPSFLDGDFEVQSESSQLVAYMCDVNKAQRVLDFCAGAGGKTMALAALMENRGTLVASDVDARRLARARVRLARSGVFNCQFQELQDSDDDPMFQDRSKHFDRVLVDAPCTGTGVLGKKPEGKWSGDDLGSELGRLVLLQNKVLARAGRLVRDGDGRLIYSTCSILNVENEGIVEKFLQEFKTEFDLVPAKSVWEKTLPGSLWPCTQNDFLKLSPGKNGMEGFFVAIFERK